MALKRVYVNDAVREWLVDKLEFFWTPKGIMSPAEVIADEQIRMKKMAADIVRNHYGEIRPEVIPEPDVE